MTFEVIRDLPVTRNQTLKHFVHVAYENIIMMIIIMMMIIVVMMMMMIVMLNYDHIIMI